MKSQIFAIQAPNTFQNDLFMLDTTSEETTMPHMELPPHLAQQIQQMPLEIQLKKEYIQPLYQEFQNTVLDVKQFLASVIDTSVSDEDELTSNVIATAAEPLSAIVPKSPKCADKRKPKSQQPVLKKLKLTVKSAQELFSESQGLDLDSLLRCKTLLTKHDIECQEWLDKVKEIAMDCASGDSIETSIVAIDICLLFPTSEELLYSITMGLKRVLSMEPTPLILTSVSTILKSLITRSEQKWSERVVMSFVYLLTDHVLQSQGNWSSIVEDGVDLLCMLFSKYATVQTTVWEQIVNKWGEEGKVGKVMWKSQVVIKLCQSCFLQMQEDDGMEIPIEPANDPNEDKRKQKWSKIGEDVSNSFLYLLSLLQARPQGHKLIDPLLQDLLLLWDQVEYPITLNLITTTVGLAQRMANAKNPTTAHMGVLMEFCGKVAAKIRHLKKVVEDYGPVVDEEAVKSLLDGIDVNKGWIGKSAKIGWLEQIYAGKGEIKDAVCTDKQGPWMEIIMTWQPLDAIHDRIVVMQVKGIESDVVTTRTKSIRSLAELVQNKWISQEIRGFIVDAVVGRLSDASATVRDAATDVVTKLLLQEMNEKVWRVVLERCVDVSTSVRKRMVKFLRDLFAKSSKVQIVGVCVDRILARLNDSEDTVVDLAYKVLKEIWIEDGRVDLKAHVLVQLINNGQSFMFETLLQKFVKGQERMQGFDDVVKRMVDLILTEQDTEAEKIANAIYVISNVIPKSCSIHIPLIYSFISYSKSSDVTKQKISKMIIGTITKSVIEWENGDLKLLMMMEQELLVLLGKGTGMIKAAVPCLSNIAKITKRNDKLAKIVVKCYSVLEQHKNQEGNAMVYRCLLILSMVFASFDFEKTEQVEQVMGRKVLESCFGILVHYARKLKETEGGQVGLESLWTFSFAHSKFLIHKECMEMMDWVLTHGSAEVKCELLSMLGDYIESNQLKEGKDVNVTEDVLVGNSDLLSHEGIPSSLTQTFLPLVLQNFHTKDVNLTRCSFRVVAFALEYGYVHPISCIPSLVVMESNKDPVLARQAFMIHKKLTEKHASFVHSKNIESIRFLYEIKGDCGHANGTSLVNPLYELIRGIKSKRNEFLKSMVKLVQDSLNDLTFCKFVVELLGTLDYHTQEEVLHVLYHIDVVITLCDVDDDVELEDLEDAKLEKTCRFALLLIQLRKYLLQKYPVASVKVQQASNHQTHQEKPIVGKNVGFDVVLVKKEDIVEKVFLINIVEALE